MIPALGDDGLLPTGVHDATLDEIEVRFGKQTEVRRVQMQSLRWLADLARRSGVHRIIINGSFTTDAPEPNDIDCIALIDNDFKVGREMKAEWESGFPFVHLDVVSQAAFDDYVNDIFASDRRGRTKGMIEVRL